MSKTITVQELAARIDKKIPTQLIDVRSPGEFASGHVPGASLIPLEEVEARLADLGDGPVAILCQSGTRASMACEFIRHERPDVLVVEGGTSAWVDAGYKVVSTRKAKWSLERQVRLAAGLLVLTGTGLAAAGVAGWLYLAMFVGAGLTFAGLTNFCGMGMLFAKMPWNQPSSSSKEIRA